MPRIHVVSIVTYACRYAIMVAAVQKVLQKGKLNPNVLQLFIDTQHKWVLERIQVRSADLDF